MKVKNFFKVILSGVFLMAAAANAAELSAPQQVIQDTSNEIKLVLIKDRDLILSDPAYVYRMVDEVLVPHFDLERISGLVLGRFWNKATPEQQQTFQHEFKRMLVRTYATAFNELDDNWQTTFLQDRPGSSENDVLVRTQIIRNGPPVAVDYRIHFIDDAWKVYDVKIEGMSLVTNYRSSFSRLMRTSGMQGLLAYLSETNALKVVAATDDDGMQKVNHTEN